MNKTPFEIIREHLFSELREKKQPLEQFEIDDAISSAKEMVNEIGIEKYLKIITNNKKYTIPEGFENINWLLITQDIERSFCILVKEGVMVKGQGNVDPTWWSTKSKIASNPYYWNRYKEFLRSKMAPEIVRNTDEDTDVVMNYIGDPSLNEFSIYGMVVGHVQSGKTSNYSALINKASDAGYKFIVVIAGTLNNLRNQTQLRLNESFIGKQGDNIVGVGIYDNEQSKLPICLTNDNNDFSLDYANRVKGTLNFENIKVPILIVIKKNSSTLKNVVSWLETQYPNGISEHSMLMIDDESDYASINTKEMDDPTIINKRIRKLISLFKKTSYVAFTATPYANIFIDHEAINTEVGSDLFPSDFIYLLEPPSNYLGARHYFIENPKNHIVNIDDYNNSFPIDHKIHHVIENIPDSLIEALYLFYLNVGIRYERGFVNNHNSMLIHVSRFTNIHVQVTNHIEELVNNIKNSITIRGGLKFPYDNDEYLLKMMNTYKKYHDNSQITFDKILKRLYRILETFIVKDIHAKTKTPLLYRSDLPINAIVVGGTSLARGFTLEGLSISYFLRTTILFDTLMQMGRWFGYRDGYADLCKIFVPEEIEDNFHEIIKNTEELFDDFRVLAKSNKTPHDFGLAIKQNPNSALQITARNKLKNIKTFDYTMKFDGRLQETVKFSADDNNLKSNYEAGINFINNLLKNEKHISISSSIFWSGVSKSYVIDFLNQYKVTNDNDPLGILSKMPLPFIRDYVINRECYWDVALISGDGSIIEHGTFIEELNTKRVIRNMVYKNAENIYHYPKNQLSIPRDESLPLIAINDDVSQYKTDRKAMRAVRKIKTGKPLLLIYFVQSQITNTNTFINNILGFSISFDGSIDSKSNTVKMVVNTVYYQHLLENLNEKYDDETD
jgi:hypothetical protein